MSRGDGRAARRRVTMKLNSIFCDGIVLQAGKPVRLFGQGTGDAYAVYEGVSYPARQAGGAFVIELPPQPYGVGKEIDVYLDGERRTLHGVSFGEVLLLAGQSNLQFPIADECGEHDFDSDPELRFFGVDRPEKAESPFHEADGWVSLDADSAPRVSAVGCHVGRALRERLHVPVGVVACFQGASTMQSWLDKDAALSPDCFLPMEDRHWDSTHFPWNGDGFLYDLMFRKLIPYAFGHVIWYQGEGNTTRAEAAVYDHMLARLVDGWRRDLRDEKLPFTVVVIHDYAARDDAGWHALQDAQRRYCAGAARVSAVESADVCAHDSIHPSDKRALSARITEDVLGRIRER